MSEVSIRELHDHASDVVERAARGERITITRSGKAIAELRSVGRPPLSAQTLLSRWRSLPSVDQAALQKEIDVLTR